MSQYKVPVQKWTETEIKIFVNLYTGLLDGNDGKNAADLVRSPGYRDVPDVDSPEELVAINGDLHCTSDYRGIDMFGVKRPERLLPGGVPGDKILLRRGMAEGFIFLNRLLKDEFAGAYEVQGLDGYRSTLTSTNLHLRKAKEIAAMQGVDLTKADDLQLLQFGRAADVTCSWVRIVNDDTYLKVMEDLRKDNKFVHSVDEAIAGGVVKSTLEEALEDYITITANFGFGRAAGRGIRLNAHKNAHPGGGAFDWILRGKFRGKTVPLALFPFDFAHPYASMTFLESPDCLSRYVQLARENSELRDHLAMLGATPEDLTQNDIEVFQRAQRVWYHLIMSAGGSFYDPGDPNEPGEFWHAQLGLLVYDGRTGKVAVAEKNFGGQYPNSGNTCHTLMRVPAGSQRVATRTGNSAYAYVEKHYGHES